MMLLNRRRVRCKACDAELPAARPAALPAEQMALVAAYGRKLAAEPDFGCASCRSKVIARDRWAHTGKANDDWRLPLYPYLLMEHDECTLELSRGERLLRVVRVIPPRGVEVAAAGATSAGALRHLALLCALNPGVWPPAADRRALARRGFVPYKSGDERPEGELDGWLLTGGRARLRAVTAFGKSGAAIEATLFEAQEEPAAGGLPARSEGRVGYSRRTIEAAVRAAFGAEAPGERAPAQGDEARAFRRGYEAGRREALRAALRDLCAALYIPLSAKREALLAAADDEALARLREALLARRVWPQ